MKDDKLFRAMGDIDEGYLDEASKAQNEVSELKREVFRLQQRLDARK